MYLLPIPALTLDDIIKFWSYTMRLEEDQCWNWVGACTGYDRRTKRPTFKIRRIGYTAARVAWMIEHGQDPGELLVCHSCRPAMPDLPQLCVNPKHLYLGTFGDNQSDAYAKGERGGSRYRLENHDVVKIRELHASGFGPTRISEMYNCSISTVKDIIAYRTFQDVR